MYQVRKFKSVGLHYEIGEVEGYKNFDEAWIAQCDYLRAGIMCDIIRAY